MSEAVKDPLAFLIDNGMPMSEVEKFRQDGIPLEEVASTVQRMIDRGDAPLPSEESPPPTLSIISAVDLQQKSIPPIRWIVQDFLPAGLSILASPPKFGKSWLAMHLCLSVAMGGTFLGFQCHKTGCLYMALEDGERRLKSRMQKILYPVPAPQGFDFTTMAPTLGNGLMDALEGYVKLHPEIGLIVLDTLQKIRDVGGGKDVYGKDYSDISALKRFADTHTSQWW